MLLPDPSEIDPCFIPDDWTIAIGYWYDQLPGRAQDHVIDQEIMTTLQFEVPEKVATICEKHVGVITINDVARCRERVFWQIDGFSRETMFWLADFLRFTDRRTRKNWVQKMDLPELLKCSA